MGQITQTCKRNAFLIASLLGLSAILDPAKASVSDNELKLFTEAWIAEMTGDAEAANTNYAALAKTNPDVSSIHEGLWQSSILTGDQRNAIRAARLKELAGDANENSLLLFSTAVKANKWAEAENSLTALSNGSNYDFLLPLLRAWLETAQGNSASFSLADSSDILKFYASDQPAYFLLARRDLVSAKGQLVTYSKLDSDFAINLRLQAAPVFHDSGDRAFASALLDGIMPADLSGNYLKSKRVKSARVGPISGLTAVFLRLGDGLIQQKAPDKAAALARIATWVDPENDAAKLLLARAFLNIKESGPALEILATISAQSAYWFQASAIRVEELLKQERAGDAVSLSRKLLSSRPSPSIIIMLARAQEEAGDLEGAKASYAILLNEAKGTDVPPSRRAQFAFFLGTVEAKSGNWDKARPLLEQSVKLSPENAYILNYLGYSLLERNEDTELAFSYLDKAYQLEPDSSAITDSLGWAYFQKGNYDQAVIYLEKAVRGAGSDLVINEHLGDAYWLSGRFFDARNAWKIAAFSAKDDDAERLRRKLSFGVEKPREPAN